MKSMQFHITDEDHTEQLGQLIARLIDLPLVIYLEGDLGAGKTRLSRAILHGCGHKGVVKSPTYTLVEPYQLADMTVYHFDLYRLAEPSELDFMGIRDYFIEKSLVLVEWPERGRGYLNPQDVTIHLSFAGEGRDCVISAHTLKGNALLEQLKQNL